MLTRRTLLSRLRDVDDGRSWREFFETYWRFIFSVARRTGMREADCEELVQDVMLGVAKEMPDFRYDPAKGSFRGWLMRIVHRRIADFWRRGVAQRRATVSLDDQPTYAEPAVEDFEKTWDEEWRKQMLDAALRRVSAKAGLKQCMIFEMAVLRGASVAEIKAALGVGLPLIYVAKHRIGKLVKAELARIEREG